MKKDTSWEFSAEWYDDLLKGEGTYQKELILPNLLRLMDIKKGETVLDLACGQGFFTREFMNLGAHAIGVDSSRTLIELARKSAPKIDFYLSKAHSLDFIKNGGVQKIAIVLALQNMEDTALVLKECARVLAPTGTLSIVLNHPSFRIPKNSSWGWDEKNNIQYRRIDSYLSESKTKIQMHPGDRPDEYTISFHRPFQFYFKALAKAGFGVTQLEEWNSHKKSGPGPRAQAEDTARKEIPLFLFLKAEKK
ncbi:MAG: methyltransferase domain-containing protein [bacterium]|nr:methyltransferase domain-containing protein [bacterium]